VIKLVYSNINEASEQFAKIFDVMQWEWCEDLDDDWNSGYIPNAENIKEALIKLENSIIYGSNNSGRLEVFTTSYYGEDWISDSDSSQYAYRIKYREDQEQIKKAFMNEEFKDKGIEVVPIKS